MKLLTILAAFLLSFSAFSQDIIEYSQGTFSRNGEELSIQEVEQLTKELKAGWYTKRCLNEGKRANERTNIRVNRLYTIMTAGIGGLVSYGYFELSDLAEWHDWRVLQKSFYGLGVAMIPSTIFITLYTSKTEFWIKQRDESFKNLAAELNKALIQSGENQ